MFPRFILSCLLIAAVMTAPFSVSYSRIIASRGQTVYLPIYSSIFFGDKKREFDLTVTISIRNTNGKNPIEIASALYYDTKGVLIKKFMARPVILRPLESYQFVIHESDVSGGTGASCVITWSAQKEVNPPIVEAVMIGAKGQQGISFTSRGVVISDKY